MTAAAEFFAALPERLSAAGDELGAAVIAFALTARPTAAGRCGSRPDGAQVEPGVAPADVTVTCARELWEQLCDGAHGAADGLGDGPASRSAATCGWPSACARCWGSERARRRSLLALVALLLAGCAREADKHRAVPTAGGLPSFIAQSFDATGTLLVGSKLGVYRSTDGGRTWHTTSRHVWGALAAGFTQASTIVSRGRLLRARQPLLRPRRRAQALALPRRQRVLARVAARRQALRARARHVLAPLRHARLGAHVVPAAGARSCRARRAAIAVARAKGGPDVDLRRRRAAPASGAPSTPA